VIIDLTRPEHREALAWACANWRDLERERDAIKRSVYCDINLTGEQCFAIRTLSSPSDSAAIVRALLERCGVSGCSTFMSRVEFRHGNDMAYLDLADGPMFDRCAAWVPALILALLACTDAAGGLAALREAGR
jgi:hypothetical protein